MTRKAKRYVVPECSGCAKTRADGRGRVFCAAIKEPAYFWAKYGSCPGYAADGSTDGVEDLAPYGRPAGGKEAGA